MVCFNYHFLIIHGDRNQNNLFLSDSKTVAENGRAILNSIQKRQHSRFRFLASRVQIIIKNDFVEMIFKR